MAPRSPQEACYGVFYRVAWICVCGLATCIFRQGDAAWFGIMTFDFFFFFFQNLIFYCWVYKFLNLLGKS